MGDRRVVTYQEPRNEFGPYWTLEIERSSSGDPTLLITVRSEMYDRDYADLDREMTIIVNDADVVLAPANAWLKTRRAEKGRL